MGKAWYGNRKMTTLLITGAKGFIGCGIAEQVACDRRGNQH